MSFVQVLQNYHLSIMDKMTNKVSQGWREKYLFPIHQLGEFFLISPAWVANFGEKTFFSEVYKLH